MDSGQLLCGIEVLEKIFNDIPFFQTPHIVIEPLDTSKPSLHGIDMCSSSLTGISKLPASAHCPIMNADPIKTAHAAFLNPVQIYTMWLS